MKLHWLRNTALTLLVAGSCVGLGALAGQSAQATTLAPAASSAEASLPQASKRITNWALDGYKGIWVQDGWHQWYYGQFLGPCLGATPDNIAFSFTPGGSLDRFSKVIVHRHGSQVCALTSFVLSGEPGSGGHLSSAAAS